MGLREHDAGSRRPLGLRAEVVRSKAMARKSTVAKAKCALCGAKEVSEPRGEERYCRDCWEKKIAVEEIVAREFALKRYIRPEMFGDEFVPEARDPDQIGTPKPKPWEGERPREPLRSPAAPARP